MLIVGMAVLTAADYDYFYLSQHGFPGTMGISSRNLIHNNVNHHLEKRSPTLITKALFKKLLLLKVLKKLKLG